jgi:hypothetical protein
MVMTSGCVRRTASPSNATYYRLTLEIDEHGYTRTESTIIAIAHTAPQKWAASMDVERGYVIGEAPAVALHDNRVVFATLRQDPDPAYPAGACAAPTDSRGRGYKVGGRLGESGPGPAGAKLLLVAFKEPNSPQSLEVVDPSDPTPVLGEGVVVHAVRFEPLATVSSTPEPTHGLVARRIPWIAHLAQNTPLDGADPGTSYCDQPVPLSHVLVREDLLGS